MPRSLRPGLFKCSNRTALFDVEVANVVERDAEIGLVMLIGLAAKNTILIVEFAQMEVERGKSSDEAALNAARLRLRPILMLAFAFILGCVPLMRATGAGAIPRRVLGTVVIERMLAASVIGIFLVPVCFDLAERFAHRGAKIFPAPHRPLPTEGD